MLKNKFAGSNITSIGHRDLGQANYSAKADNWNVKSLAISAKNNY